MTGAGPSGVELSFDAGRLDVDLIHRFLATEAYWSPGIPRARVEAAIAHSLCVGAYAGGAQVGFARVVTDRATFAYLCDVFVVDAARGRGTAQAMVDALRGHSALQGLRRWLLFTADAHPLYRKLGFSALARPERGMEIMAIAPYGTSVSAR